MLYKQSVRAVAASLIVGPAALLAPSRAYADVRAFDDPYDVPTSATGADASGADSRRERGDLRGHRRRDLAKPERPDRARVRAGACRSKRQLGLRRWYVGANYEVAESSTAVLRAVSGNVELEGRTLWATPTGLAFGGGLGLMLPTANFEDASPAGDAALRAATLRPWDVSFFVPNAFGPRPFVDVRAVDGAFVIQFRQGLDFMFSTTALANWRVYATTGVYFGWWITHAVAAGFEAFEAYAIDVPGVRDGARASVVVSPNVRLALRWIQPAISMFTERRHAPPRCERANLGLQDRRDPDAEVSSLPLIASARPSIGRPSAGRVRAQVSVS